MSGIHGSAPGGLLCDPTSGSSFAHPRHSGRSKLAWKHADSILRLRCRHLRHPMPHLAPECAEQSFEKQLHFPTLLRQALPCYLALQKDGQISYSQDPILRGDDCATIGTPPSGRRAPGAYNSRRLALRRDGEARRPGRRALVAGCALEQRRLDGAGRLRRTSLHRDEIPMGKKPMIQGRRADGEEPRQQGLADTKTAKSQGLAGIFGAIERWACHRATLPMAPAMLNRSPSEGPQAIRRLRPRRISPSGRPEPSRHSSPVPP